MTTTYSLTIQIKLMRTYTRYTKNHNGNNVHTQLSHFVHPDQDSIIGK